MMKWTQNGHGKYSLKIKKISQTTEPRTITTKKYAATHSAE